MAATAGLSKYAFTLDLQRLRAALKPGVSLDGLLIAAASAHDPESRVQRAVIRLLNCRGVNETDKNGVTPLHRAVRSLSLIHI